MSTVSKYGVVSVCFFLFFSILFRLVLPFGDEPDFSVRAVALSAHAEKSFYAPYYFIHNIINEIETHSNCKIESSPFSIIASINPTSCAQGYEEIAKRILFVAVTALPIFVVVIFRKQITLFFVRRSHKGKFLLFSNRLDSLSVTIVCSSYIYYIGVVGYESFQLMLTTLILFFVDKPLIALTLFFSVFVIDTGDSFVLITFLFFYWGYSYIVSRFGAFYAIALTIMVAIFGITVNTVILDYLTFIDALSAKSQAIADKYEGESFRDKYPVILRPVVTFMSFVFFTPNYLKSILSYILVGGAFFWLIIDVFKYAHSNHLNSRALHTSCIEKEGSNFFRNKVFSGFFASFSTILFFVFTFPDYANAKYYIFMLPFIVSFVLLFRNKYMVMYFMVLINFIVLLEVYLGYLN